MYYYILLLYIIIYYIIYYILLKYGFNRRTDAKINKLDAAFNM